jgi:hypothetical protein
MVDVGNFLSLDVANLDTKLENYFKLSFIMTKLVNLDTMLGFILDYIL